MNIAIIGAGNVGTALATATRRSGHEVVIASASGDSARAAATQAGARAAASNREAAAHAQVIILAVPYTAVGDVLEELGGALDGKIVVDVTNPLKPDSSGLATEATSAAEEIQERAENARVVKAFNTVFASRQADPVVAGGLRLDAYVAGDDEAAKRTVLDLAEAMGFNPIDVGELAMARYLEGMAWLNISLQLKNGWSWQASWKIIGPDGDAG